jgi:hypothetical protein
MRPVPVPIITAVIGFCLAALLLPVPPSVTAHHNRPACAEVPR